MLKVCVSTTHKMNLLSWDEMKDKDEEGSSVKQRINRENGREGGRVAGRWQVGVVLSHLSCPVSLRLGERRLTESELQRRGNVI